MHSNKAFNDKLAVAMDTIQELIGWLKADAQHATENGAPEIAKGDLRRVRWLIKAYNILCDCKRET